MIRSGLILKCLFLAALISFMGGCYHYYHPDDYYPYGQTRLYMPLPPLSLWYSDRHFSFSTEIGPQGYYYPPYRRYPYSLHPRYRFHYYRD